MRRRAEIATLRSLGVDGSVLFSLIYWKHLYWVYLVQLQEWGGANIGNGVSGYAFGYGECSFLPLRRGIKSTFDDLVVGIVLGLILSMIAGWLPAEMPTKLTCTSIGTRGLVSGFPAQPKWSSSLLLGVGFYYCPQF